MVVLTTTICANAQFKIGILKKNLYKGTDLVSYSGGEVAYTETKNGKVKIYIVIETDYQYIGIFSRNLVDFCGYYHGEVKDPRDEYVNIRKGPGTNYPIVGKVYVGNFLIFKKTDSNWYEVYNRLPYPEKGDDGFLHLERYFYKDDSYYCIGYIYKDRIKSPNYYAY